jgi:hypothetical protein
MIAFQKPLLYAGAFSFKNNTDTAIVIKQNEVNHTLCTRNKKDLDKYR